MIRIIIFPVFVVLLLLATACSDDFFEQVPKNRLTSDDVFETRAGTESYLANCYAFIPDEFRQRYAHQTTIYRTGGPWSAGCDEAEYVWSFVGSHYLNNNTLTPKTDMVKKFWKGWYSGINAASVFIKRAPECSELSADRLKQWTAEARAVRAIYYFYLLRTYGPVPLLGETVIAQDAPLEEVQVPRSPVDDCINFIVSELDKAMQEGLLVCVKASNRQNEDLGRIDQTIAQAFKVEALMLSASPLYTGGNNTYKSLKNKDGQLLFPQNLSDAEITGRWQQAAAEAKKFIDQYVPLYYDLNRIYTNGKLDAYLSYREAVRGSYTNMANEKEMIFYRIGNDIQTHQYDRTPYHNGAPNGDYRASGGMGATQEIVDSYFMANGLTPITGYGSDGITPVINPQSGYSESGYISSAYLDPVTGRQLAPGGTSTMYYQREPRFYADITFNGQKWLNEKDGAFHTWLNYNGNSGKAVGNNDYSPTGYIVRKSAPLGNWRAEDRVCILLRLAQVYLNYAEALNESNPGHPDILTYLNLIRERAGIPGYGSNADQVAAPTGQEAVRKLIRAERRVELSFENARYFDVRRWCIAEETENKPIHGMNIYKNGDEFHVRTVVEDRQFLPRLYFFPIPQSELDIDKNLAQNPGW